MPRYTIVIEDTEDGLKAELTGDAQPGEATPAGVVAIKIDALLQELLGPEYEIEDGPRSTVDG